MVSKRIIIMVTGVIAFGLAVGVGEVSAMDTKPMDGREPNRS